MGRKLHRVFAELREEISFLNGYHIAARYPNGLPDGIPATVFNRKPAEEALRAAKRAVDFVEKLLNE
ncbi:MAG TPA: HEPN domain-containing protein [Bacillota bacterium]|jgi:HEPN domain-containing protein|nr:HEPN domain-containing protein [Bacillota bacterium]HOJ83710.1 HEPN domain-containing protein [Bacillota bacterium]HOL15526.1 HEPN domain-containing protein [Bacillota bacterium]HPZ12453.1 HEPN domain-containing protein [Bacillota bacterium]HQE10402.1 HEPN domain-containing protein [Bacillota bacterium]